MEPKKQNKLTSRIEKYIRKGQMDKAIKHLKQELIRVPNDGYLHYMLGFVYRNDGQYQLAEKEFRTAEELKPDDPWTKWELARFLVNLDRPEEALNYALSSVEEWPTGSDPHAVLGNAYLKLKRYAEAEEFLLKAIELSKWNPDARYWLMEVYEQTERFELIQPALQEYVDEAPNLACSHVFMAEYLHYDLGDCISAFPFYEKGLILAQTGKNSSWYRNFFSTSGYPQRVVDYYAHALIERKLFDAAEAVARENYKKDELAAWRASVLSEHGDNEGALKMMSKALESQPNAPNWHSLLGRILIKLGDYTEAERALRSSIELSNRHGTPLDIWVLGALVVTLRKEEKAEEVKAVLDQGLELFPERLWIALAYHHYEAGDWEYTIQTGMKALKYDKRLGYTLACVAEAHTHLGEFEKAVDMYQRILEFQPRNGRIWLALGEVYAENDDIKKAIEALRHALDEKMLSRVEEKEAEKRVAEFKIMQ